MNSEALRSPREGPASSPGEPRASQPGEPLRRSTGTAGQPAARQGESGGSGATAVDIVCPRLDPADAVGTHARLLHRTLAAHGYRSRLWASSIHDDLRAEASPVEGLFRCHTRSAAVVYQFASSCPLAARLARLDNLIVDYHGLTPPELLRPWHPHAATDVSIARSDLAVLAAGATAAMADSRFIEADLRAAGARTTAVTPLLMEPSLWTLGAESRSSRPSSGRAGGARLLSVGRIASSKAVEDLVAMLAAYRAVYDPSARLTVIGRPVDGPYANALRAMAYDLGVSSAVHFAGRVSTEELSRYYAEADVLVSASRHEGYSATLVEAMVHGLPVVARRSGAVAETVGAAAVLLPDSSPFRMAAAVRRAVVDDLFRSRLRSAGERRAQQLSPQQAGKAVVAALAQWIGPPGSAPEDDGWGLR